nr:penicillin-binding transpeptidase domain-containing protein [bacterium]
MKHKTRRRSIALQLPDIRTQKRITWLLGIVGALFLLLIGRLAYLQLYKSDWLQAKAQDQWTRELIITPWRGAIRDVNGELLAQSVACEALVLHPREIEKAGNADVIADSLAPIIGVERDVILQRATRSAYEVLLKRQITQEEADKVRALKLRGVAFTADRKRVYPENTMLSRVLGYVTIDGVGQEGLEAYYEKYLKGEPGRMETETTITGEELPYAVENYVPPVPGLDATLTIDSIIQHFAEQAVAEVMEQYTPQFAGCIVMDVNTGAVLAMAGGPTMDLNNVPRNDIALLQSLSRNPMIQDVYDPGSTFKVITTASALEEGVVTADSTFTCSGGRTIDGVKIHCWKRTGAHGTQTLMQAVRNSCNPVFIDLALRLGKERFYSYLEKFGFGQNTGIDFYGEAKGIVTPVQYVQNVDLACMGFGQSISVTPIQLISAFSAVVNGGTKVTPHFVQSLKDSDGNVIQDFTPLQGERIISEATSAIMREILEFTVRDGIKGAYVPGYRVGGKTGTSQIFKDGALVQGKHVSSFIGFAPADNPRFAVLMLVNQPETAVDFGSVVAAPYAGKIIANVLNYYKVPKDALAGEEDVLKTVKVPNVVGMSAEQADEELAKAGLNAILTGDGTVVSQFPAAEEEIYTGMTVTAVTDQPFAEDEGQPVEVPDVTGLSIPEALSRLSAYGLNLKIQGGSGVAVSQNPAAGTQSATGQDVIVTFSE